ncbi:MAG: hypothetical protein QW597_05480 [Thermoplasmataceae archaeon]
MTGSSTDKIPANVRNIRPRIGGIDARKISSLIATLMVSLLILHYNPLLSIIFAVGGVILSLMPSEEGFFPGTIGQYLRTELKRKSGTLKLEYHVDCVDGICTVLKGKLMFAIATLKGLPAQMLSYEESFSETEMISSIIDKLYSRVSFVAYSEMLDVSSYIIKETDDDSLDYNGLVSYIFEDVRYYRSFLLLSVDTLIDFSRSMNLLRKDCETLREGLKRSGIEIAFMSDISEIGRLLGRSL